MDDGWHFLSRYCDCYICTVRTYVYAVLTNVITFQTSLFFRFSFCGMNQNAFLFCCTGYICIVYILRFCCLAKNVACGFLCITDC